MFKALRIHNSSTYIAVLFTILLVRADPQFYPQFQTGYGSCDAGYPNSGLTKAVVFTQEFSSAPQVLLALCTLFNSQDNNIYIIEPYDASKSGFNFKCTYNSGFSHIAVRWLAFLDDNLFVQYGSQLAPASTLNIIFGHPQISIPVAQVFINGLDVTNTISGNMHITMGTITLTSIVVNVITTNTLQINKIFYSLIYGASLTCNYFQVLLTNSFLISYTYSDNVGVVFGLLEYDFLFTNTFAMQNYIGVSSETAPTRSYSGAGSIGGSLIYPSLTFTAAFCFYTPGCPLFCTSCTISGYPNCDACLAGTQRLLAGNCLTCPAPMYASNSYLNCQSCLNVCDSCTTGTTCTVCSAVSLRISPSTACNQCPSQMFVQVGSLICKQCTAYCDNCLFEAGNCLACLPGSGRSNPPLCNQCSLAQNYIQKGQTNCQSTFLYNLACNNYCNGCSEAATQCLACAGGTQRTIPPLCATCPSQMFVQLSVVNCQSCALYCDNCQVSATTCISCQTSTLRSLPPNCTTCPSNMFILAGQDNCQQCNPLCNQCLGAANNCLGCNGLYRTNPPNCDQCQLANYYIDALFIDCQRCASYCNGCLSSSTNCIACQPFIVQNLSTQCPLCPISEFLLTPPMCNIDYVAYVCSSNFNRDSSCNCLPGFYNSETSIACLKCSTICNTCTSSAVNCLTCNSISLYLSQPPLCNQCIDGYFMLYGSCTKCSSSCNTCTQSSSNCLICPSPRLNPPLCSCPLGYFNDCQQSCSLQCNSCTGSSANCLTCAGNRINPPLCGCSDGSIQSTAICSSCTLIAPIARFANDLNSIYLIFSSGIQQTKIDCQTLLNQKTLVTIGSGPLCTINSNIITITLGQNATINLNSPIFINPDVVYLINCNKSITTIVTPLVQLPQNIFPPGLVFNSEIFTTTPCDVVQINIIRQIYSGSRTQKLLNWSTSAGSNSTKLQSLLNVWNSKQLQSSYIISQEYLKTLESIQLTINYANFLGEVGSQTIKIFIQDSSLQLSVQVPNEVYIFDRVQILFVASYSQCRQEYYDERISVYITISNSSSTLNYNYMLQADQQGMINFDPFQLGKQSTYYINAIAKYKTYQVQTQETFKTILSNVFVSIRGGDQMIGINQQLQLEANVFNPNNQTAANDLTYYSAIWRCIDIVTNLECNIFSQSNFTAQLNTTQSQPLTTLYVTIQVFDQSNLLIGADNITIQIIENSINPIYLTGNQYSLNLPMNVYDEVDILIQYQNQQKIDVDNLTYQSQYLSSTYQQNSVSFHHQFTSIILQNFNATYNNKFKVMIYKPGQLSPSIATLNIRINQPPKQCQLSIFTRGEKFAISINSCTSQSQPLQYKFIYYATKDGFMLDSLNGVIQNGIQLTDYQIRPTLITYLYGEDTSLIVGLVKDSQNGIANTTLSLQKYRNIDSTLLFYMLQDSQQNLQRNIMFMSIYLQINNQIFTNEYFNKVSEITTRFNQTDQMTLYIQQQLASQKALIYDEITSQLTKTSSYINNISLQLAQLQNDYTANKYNKNYQVQLIGIQQSLVETSQKISFLYGQSQLVNNRRLLDVTTQNIITSMITEAVSKITDIFGSLTKVNQDQKVINVTQFNLTAQKFSTLKANEHFNFEIVNESNQIVSYKSQNFSINPYMNESDFVSPIKAPLIIPNLTGSNDVQITPANPIPIKFELQTDEEVSCASKIQGFWSMDVCKIVKSGSSIRCLCQTLSPVTIAQALEFVLGQYASLFRGTIIRKISQFAYGLSLFTYIIALFVILYFVTMYILFKIDNIEEAKVQPVDDLQLKNSEDDRYKIMTPPEFDLAGTSMKVITVIDQPKIEEPLYTKTSIIGSVKIHQVTTTQGFKMFLQNSHELFELYYRYDDQQPRILRLSILFLQIVGQICIFVLFGKNLTLSIIIALSIFQTTYGVLYQLILSQMIKSKNHYVRAVGIAIALLLTGFSTYLIIAAMALYSSNYDSNIAALSYLASLCVDLFFSNILVELAKYVFILKTCDQRKFYKIYDMLWPKGLQELLFGRMISEVKTKTQIAY